MKVFRNCVLIWCSQFSFITYIIYQLKWKILLDSLAVLEPVIKLKKMHLGLYIYIYMLSLFFPWWLRLLFIAFCFLCYLMFSLSTKFWSHSFQDYENFESYICKAYTGDLPKACEVLPLTIHPKWIASADQVSYADEVITSPVIRNKHGMKMKMLT